MASRNTEYEAILAKKPTLKELLSHVPVYNRWYNLGLALDLEHEKLDKIKIENQNTSADDRLREMFQLWLRVKPHGTHRDIVRALQEKPVEENTIASNYVKYLESLVVTRHPDVSADVHVPSMVNRNLATSETLIMMEKTISQQDDFLFKAMGKNLQQSYRKLLYTIQVKAQEIGNLRAMKNVVKTLLLQTGTGSFPQIDEYVNEIDKITNIDQLFDFLVNNKFIGYLNFVVLEDFVAIIDDEKLQQQMHKYTKDFAKFIEEPNFVQLIEIFSGNPSLQPNTIVGLPTIVIYLADKWKNCNMRDLQQYIPFVQQCKLQLDSIGKKSVIITYIIFPKYLKKLKEYQINGKFLKAQGIEIEIQETTMMRDDCTEMQTNHQMKLKQLMLQVYTIYCNFGSEIAASTHVKEIAILKNSVKQNEPLLSSMLKFVFAFLKNCKNNY